MTLKFQNKVIKSNEIVKFYHSIEDVNNRMTSKTKGIFIDEAKNNKLIMFYDIGIRTEFQESFHHLKK